MNDKADFKLLRVLVAAGSRGTVLLLRQLFSVLGMRDVSIVTTYETAHKALSRERFDVAFFDTKIDAGGACPLVRMVRQTGEAADPLIPIFLMTNQPSRSLVEAARDDGFTDVIVSPVSIDTIKRKLQVALAHPVAFKRGS
jgi:CheY-like chemotaxis protein